MSNYPQPVKEWIRCNDGLIIEMIKIGTDLWKIVDHCPEDF
jgi:hypothetical protein